LILTQPDRYGFHLQDKDYYPPLRFTNVELTSSEETSLTVVAQAAQTDFKRIKDLNPELRGHYLAAGTYTLAFPENTPPGVQKRFNSGHQKWSQQRKERIYIVQPGDNLSTIAEQFRVPLAAILIWNRIDIRMEVALTAPNVVTILTGGLFLFIRISRHFANLLI
jgi:LysM repeat protein